MDRIRDAGHRMPFHDYLVMEERSSVKHEYVAGEVYAMSGVTMRHGRIAFNIAAHLRNAARARRCAIVLSEVKLRAPGDRIYYPDLILACGNAAEVENIVEQPSLVVEVTSPGTRATDRREKLDAYLQIASLRAYLIVDQRRRHALAYTRDLNGEWMREEIQGHGEIVIPFLDLRVSIADFYEDVQLPPLTVNEGEDWDYAWEPDHAEHDMEEDE